MENINNNIDKILSPDERLEELGNKLTQQYGDYDGDGYSYQIEYSEKKENGDYDLESQKIYKAEMMGEVFNIGLETPEQMINILKLTDYILSLYMKEGYSISKGDKFYTKEGFMSGANGVGEKIDLYIDNRPTEILDTIYLSQEKLKGLLIDKGDDFTNNFMEEYALFLNKIIEKVSFKKRLDKHTDEYHPEDEDGYYSSFNGEYYGYKIEKDENEKQVYKMETLGEVLEIKLNFSQLKQLTEKTAKIINMFNKDGYNTTNWNVFYLEDGIIYIDNVKENIISGNGYNSSEIIKKDFFKQLGLSNNESYMQIYKDFLNKVTYITSGKPRDITGVYNGRYKDLDPHTFMPGDKLGGSINGSGNTGGSGEGGGTK